MTVDLQEAEAYNRTLQGGEITYMQVTKATVVWQTIRGLKVDGKLGPVTRQDLDFVGNPESVVPEVASGNGFRFVVQQLSDDEFSVEEVG